MKQISGLMVVWAVVFAAVLALLKPWDASATDPSVLMGLPKPSAVPSCAAGDAGFHSDPAGAIYACANGQRSLVAAPKGGSAAFPTATATATLTPTPTVTST